MSDRPLRVAVVSSPRSGNSWIRSTLAGALGMSEFAVHNYLEVPSELPERCFLQVHWYREPNFQAWLRARGFKTMTVARHPLDVLISVLHYVRYEPGTSRWLEGNADLPGSLMDSAPCSREFLEYGTSFGAENLLSISYQWWHEDQVIKVRYEDAVDNPPHVLGALVQGLGGDPSSVLPWLERLSLTKMRELPNRHGWQARPGLWRKLITPTDAVRIFGRHRQIFRKLGYSVRPYVLSRSAALRNWKELA
jgi:hypothetical protein